MQMLCRNRVTDFDAWWRVFESHRGAHEAAGLSLRKLWRNTDDEKEVFFLFDVEDRDRAQAFLEAPESAEAGRASGVLDGDYRYVIEGDSYGD